MKKIYLGVLLLAFFINFSPVLADSGMLISEPTPVAITTNPILTHNNQFDALVNKMVITVLKALEWKNEAGSISFTDTNYSVNYGCNTIFGTYSIYGKMVNFGMPASTLMACPMEAMDADQTLVKNLEAINTLTFKDGNLVMSGKDAELKFKATLPKAK